MKARWTYDGKGTSCWRIMDPGVQWAVGLNADGTWGVTKHDARGVHLVADSLPTKREAQAAAEAARADPLALGCGLLARWPMPKETP